MMYLNVSLTHVEFVDVVSQCLHVDTLCSEAETLISGLFDPIVDIGIVGIQDDDGQLPTFLIGLS